jgi:LmbE family N-acetylglucosaminyl deacetylase
MIESEIERVLVVAAHPDDADIGCGGTMAKWARQGKEVVYLICTRGDKGRATRT